MAVFLSKSICSCLCLYVRDSFVSGHPMPCAPVCPLYLKGCGARYIGLIALPGACMYALRPCAVAMLVMICLNSTSAPSRVHMMPAHTGLHSACLVPFFTIHACFEMLLVPSITFSHLPPNLERQHFSSASVHCIESRLTLLGYSRGLQERSTKLSDCNSQEVIEPDLLAHLITRIWLLRVPADACQCHQPPRT